MLREPSRRSATPQGAQSTSEGAQITRGWFGPQVSDLGLVAKTAAELRVHKKDGGAAP